MAGLLGFQVKRGLRRVFDQGGQEATWYHYSGIAGGSPEYGIGPAETYVTGTCRVIQDQFRPTEVQLAGGQINADDSVVWMREELSKDDMVRLGTVDYRVNAVPVAAHLEGEPMYRVWLTRA